MALHKGKVLAECDACHYITEHTKAGSYLLPYGWGRIQIQCQGMGETSNKEVCGDCYKRLKAIFDAECKQLKIEADRMSRKDEGDKDEDETD